MTDEKETPPRTGASKDEVALELMRFITTTTGIGKTSTGAGFGGKVAEDSGRAGGHAASVV